MRIDHFLECRLNAQSFRVFLILSTLVVLSACGGGSPSTNAPDRATVNPEYKEIAASLVGIYDVDYGSFQGVYTLLEDGRFSGIHYFQDLDPVGQPFTDLLPGEVSSLVRKTHWANFGAGNGLGVMESGVHFNRSLDSSGVLHVDISSRDIGFHEASAKAQKTYARGSSQTLYFDPIPMSVLAGIYRGRSRSAGLSTPTVDLEDFSLSAQGVFAVSAGGCAYSGQLSQVGKTGVFNVAALAKGSACKVNSGLSGIVTPLSLVDGKASLGLQLVNEDSSQSMVFVLQKK